MAKMVHFYSKWWIMLMTDEWSMNDVKGIVKRAESCNCDIYSCFNNTLK